MDNVNKSKGELAVTNQEEYLSPSDKFNFILLVPIILAFVGSALGTINMFKRRRRPSRRKQTKGQLMLQLFRNTTEHTEPVPDERLDELILTHYLDEIQKLGDKLFADGAYLNVINYFNQTSITLLKYGLIDESFRFSQRATNLKALVDEREKKLQLLEREKQRKDLMEVMLLYNDIIELSRKLHDRQAVKYYQYELHQVRSVRQITSRKQATMLTPLVIKRIMAEPPVNAQIKEVKLNKIINSLQNEIENFALKDLNQKRDTFEERAKFLEERCLFKAASFFYEKCEKISNQLAQIGMAGENSNAQKFNEKKVECSQKQHYEEKKAEFSKE